MWNCGKRGKLSAECVGVIGPSIIHSDCSQCCRLVELAEPFTFHLKCLYIKKLLLCIQPCMFLVTLDTTSINGNVLLNYLLFLLYF